MTPKEKAAEILNKFLFLVDCGDNRYSTATQIKNAKQCALIAVDEILDNRCGMRNDEFIENSDIYCNERFWNEVKNELFKDL